MSNRQYGRDDVSYETWYSSWMKDLAKLHTKQELEDKLYGASKAVTKAANQHLRAVQRSTSMQGASAARAHARNNVTASGELKIALTGAIEIHELFPEHAKA